MRDSWARNATLALPLREGRIRTQIGFFRFGRHRLSNSAKAEFDGRSPTANSGRGSHIGRCTRRGGYPSPKTAPASRQRFLSALPQGEVFVPETRWTPVRGHRGHIFPSKGDGLQLLLVLWTLWATRSVVHKSTGRLAIALAKVERGDPVNAIVHVKDAVLAGRPKRDWLAAQGLADAPRAVLEADEALDVDLADLVARRVLDRRQIVGEGSWARPVALSRRCHAERLMRPLVVIALTPFIKGALTIRVIAEALSVHHLGGERAMEAFLLALRLRMIRPAVQHADAQPHQPHGEAGMRIPAQIAPRWATIHQHGERQAKAGEGSFQMRGAGLALLV